MRQVICVRYLEIRKPQEPPLMTTYLIFLHMQILIDQSDIYIFKKLGRGVPEPTKNITVKVNECIMNTCTWLEPNQNFPIT